MIFKTDDRVEFKGMSFPEDHYWTRGTVMLPGHTTDVRGRKGYYVMAGKTVHFVYSGMRSIRLIKK